MKTIALTIMCKNENVDLKENIEYHTLLGIDHFIIYDNNSKHPLKEDLKNYKKLHDWLVSNASPQQYMDVLDEYLKILDRTRADIPRDMQDYWIANQERLGLTGKFLPDDSNLIKYK